jgi:hypothetical protein
VLEHADDKLQVPLCRPQAFKARNGKGSYSRKGWASASSQPQDHVAVAALIAFIAATAEAQTEAIREAQRAGIAHARANEPHSYRGRKPSFDRAQLGTIRDMLAQDASPTVIAEAAGVSRQVAYRVQDDPAKAERCCPSVGCSQSRTAERGYRLYAGRDDKRGGVREGVGPTAGPGARPCSSRSVIRLHQLRAPRFALDEVRTLMQRT